MTIAYIEAAIGFVIMIALIIYSVYIHTDKHKRD